MEVVDRTRFLTEDVTGIIGLRFFNTVNGNILGELRTLEEKTLCDVHGKTSRPVVRAEMLLLLRLAASELGGPLVFFI